MTDPDALDHDPEDAAPPPLTMEFCGKTCRTGVMRIALAQALRFGEDAYLLNCQGMLYAATLDSERVAAAIANIAKAREESARFFEDCGIKTVEEAEEKALPIIKWFWDGGKGDPQR